MADIDTKLKKSFESLNKNLYRTNKVVELYTPLYEIINNISKDLKDISEIKNKNSHLEKDIEKEIKKRELISLFKKMHTTVCEIKEDIDVFYKDMCDGNKFLEEYRSYRTYVFADTLKTKDFIKKIIDSFNIEEFILKFNVVGTVDLLEISEKIKGRKMGIDIVMPSKNIDLVFEEILKSKATKFRLISENIVIYFEKDTILYIEGLSKKIKLCDIDAQSFNAKIIDN
ncbi:MAG: hypothetical protein PHN22_00125 [Candidatus ainarchaeum sp.]|nr:hypothetical protein [Candidatus ainarchaeum sp.]